MSNDETKKFTVSFVSPEEMVEAAKAAKTGAGWKVFPPASRAFEESEGSPFKPSKDDSANK